MKTVVVPLGPFHPLLEEAEYFKLFVEGETVVDMDLQVGYMHRGIEKLCESKTFDQVPFVVERICGICSTSHPLAYVNAVEDLIGVEIPERAKYIRTIIAELERIHSHLLWMGLAGHFIGYDTVFMWAWRYREPVLDLFELISGNRNHYAMMNVGGVRRDIKEDDYGQILSTLDEVKGGTELFIGAVMDDPVIHARTKGIGVLTPEDARAYGTLGPTVRGSGIPDDIRRDDPYAAYDMVEWDVCTYEGGDVFAKTAVRLLETIEAIKIIGQCVEQMRPGPICADVQTIPAGEGTGHAEAPRGEVFHYVRSDGSSRPVRHKVRAPSLMNIPSFKVTCIGEKVADAALITAAVDPCYCCTERTAAVDKGSDKAVLTGGDLIEMSRRKTAQIRNDLGCVPPVEKLVRGIMAR